MCFWGSFKPLRFLFAVNEAGAHGEDPWAPGLWFSLVPQLVSPPSKRWDLPGITSHLLPALCLAGTHSSCSSNTIPFSSTFSAKLPSHKSLSPHLLERGFFSPAKATTHSSEERLKLSGVIQTWAPEPRSGPPGTAVAKKQLMETLVIPQGTLSHEECAAFRLVQSIVSPPWEVSMRNLAHGEQNVLKPWAFATLC